MPNQKKNHVVVAVNLNQETVEALDLIVAKVGSNRAAYVRQLIVADIVRREG